MKRLTVTISGETWQVRRMSDSRFTEVYGKESIAMTHYRHTRVKPLRLISFRPTGLQISTIRHELTHAYLSYHSLGGLGLKDLEEFFADFVGSKLRLIDRLAERIHRELA